MDCMYRTAFTWVEMLVGITVIVVVLVAGFVLLRPIRIGHPGGHHLRNSVQVRGIHQGMVIYAQGNKLGGGKGYFPGLDAEGEPVDLSVQARFKILLDREAVTPEYLLNENDEKSGHKTAWHPGSGEAFGSDHYSYAMLDISDEGGRREEWAETLNTQAVVLSDRNTGSDSDMNVDSLWVREAGTWRGTVVHNDNSTRFETTHILNDTRYDGGEFNATDNLFESAGTEDALLIHSGE